MTSQEESAKSEALMMFLKKARYNNCRCKCGILQYISTDECPKCGVVYKYNKTTRKNHQIYKFEQYLDKVQD